MTAARDRERGAEAAGPEETTEIKSTTKRAEGGNLAYNY